MRSRSTGWLTSRPAEDYEGAVGAIVAESQPGDVVVVDPPLGRTTVEYYLRDAAIAVRPERVTASLRRGTRAIDEQDLVVVVSTELAARHRVWIVRRDEGQQPIDLGEPDDVEPFGRIRVERYDPVDRRRGCRTYDAPGCRASLT